MIGTEMTTPTNDPKRPPILWAIQELFAWLRDLLRPRRRPDDPPRLPSSPEQPRPAEDGRIPFVCGNEVFTTVSEYRDIERLRKVHTGPAEPHIPPLVPSLNAYIPEMNHPVKVVCINFHIFRNSNGQGHYQEAEIDRLYQIMDWLNWWFGFPEPPSDPPKPPPSLIRDTRIRFKLHRVEFYDDDTLHVSTSVTVMQAAAVARNASTLDQLNVYFTMGTMPNTTGFATLPSAAPNYDSWVVLLNSYNSEDWSRTGVLAHELGHTLDLFHTYSGGAGAADCTQGAEFLHDVFGTAPSTCPHVADWWATASGGSPLVTNNLMGGNREVRWISALQAARMHRALTEKSVKRYVATGCHDCLGCIAFTVHGMDHVSMGNPVRLVYQSVSLNEGWGWNTEDFIAPASGIYHFDLSFLKDAYQHGGTEDDVFVDVEKFVNGTGTLLGTAWSGEQAGKRGTGCVSLNVRLKAGDMVSTRTRSDGGFKRHVKSYTFAGHRICSC